MPRLLFDVSFTRTQTRFNGIVRTVTRLLQAMQADVDYWSEVIPVTYHSGGLRRLRDPLTITDAPPPPYQEDSKNISPSLIFRVASSVGPRLSSFLPTPVRRWAWTAYNRWKFDRHSCSDDVLEIQAGDVLFLSDGSWNYEIWKAAHHTKSAGGKVVLVVHDIMPIRRPEFCSEMFSWAFERWLVRMLRCADAVLCVSRATEADLLDWTEQNSITLPPTTHFRWGSDLIPLVSTKKVRQEIQNLIRSSAPCFASIGIFEPKKNYAFILETFENMWGKGIDANLILAGQRTNLCAQLIKDLHEHAEYGKRILAIHDASDQEVSFLYENCQALIIASLFEGFGLPLVEARTRGCPVIVNDLPVFLELADDGVFIYRQDSHDSLERTILSVSNKFFREKIKKMPHFTWSDAANQCNSKIHHLLDQTD